MAPSASRGVVFHYPGWSITRHYRQPSPIIITPILRNSTAVGLLLYSTNSKAVQHTVYS
jgi:hypothetical protein